MGGDVVVNSRAIAATEVIEPAVHDTICLYLKKGEVIMIYGINHIAISTPNLERLAAFYCEQLGFEQVFTVNWDIGNVAYDNITGLRNSSARGLILKLGNACIELFEYRTPTPRLAVAMRPADSSFFAHRGRLRQRHADATARAASTESATSFASDRAVRRLPGAPITQFVSSGICAMKARSMPLRVSGSLEGDCGAGSTRIGGSVKRPPVVENADKVVRAIIETYLAPNRTFRDVREVLDNEAMNPLRDFRNACREELRSTGFPSRSSV